MLASILARTFAVLTFLLAPSAAQWQAIPVSGAPSPRTGFTLLPLSSTELLLFGGDIGNPAATEWVWDGVAWSPLVTQVPRRIDAVGANLGPGWVVIYGGSDANGPRTDTWMGSGAGPSSWFQIASGLGPLTQLSMVGQPSVQGPVRGVMVGLSTSGLWETWFFDLAIGAWTQGPQFSAPDAKLVTDTVRRDVLLFLGGLPLLEVKRLVGDVWVSVQTGSGMNIADLAFDERRARAIVLQPFANRAIAEWDGIAVVTQQAPSGAFVSTQRTALGYHGPRSDVLMVANENGTMVTSRWIGQAGPAAFSFGTSCAFANFPLALQPGDTPELGGVHRLLVPAATNLRLLLLGTSHTQWNGTALPWPIPLSPSGCLLRVEPATSLLFAAGGATPVSLAVPSTASLLGLRYDAQVLEVSSIGVRGASNGLEVQLGLPLPEHETIETFVTPANQDPMASGGVWGAGITLGGDGRHGSFDATLGTDLGNGVYQWSTDNQAIPAVRALDGTAVVVTDGKFQFTDFVVPTGITVRFVGAVPVQLRVRGQADIQGTLDVSGVDLPFGIPTGGMAAGQRVSTFAARSATLSARVGQSGTAGGPGGGRGGNGGDKCQSAGPIVVNGIALTDGQPGENVRVVAGHAYAAATVGTNGAGSGLTPAAGTSAAASAPILQSLYRGQFSSGGSGGGFWSPGGVAVSPTIPVGIVTSALAAAGSSFAVVPFPASPPLGYTSLDHFLVGGSGGGGGGSHSFGLLAVGSNLDFYMAGSAGSGGGGALAIRAGGLVRVGAAGVLRSRGGLGVLINGDNPATANQEALSQFTCLGVASPGGGGSGGSFLLQSGVGISVTGQIDTTGGSGSRTGSINPANMNVLAQAGVGSPGSYRLESPISSLTGTCVPPFVASIHTGQLLDRDTRTGARSNWYVIPSQTLPVYVRYELLAFINGLPVLFSDDPNVSPLAADNPTGLVMMRFQGARLDPLTGLADPATAGPWRTRLVPGNSSVNLDHAQAVRFDFTLDTSVGNVSVRQLRMVWR